MIRGRGTGPVPALCLAAALLAAGCGGVVKSSPPSAARTCIGALGSYSLPKGLLQVSYREYLDDNGARTRESVSIDRVVGTEGPPVCLDHLSSATASDNIRILRRSEAVAIDEGEVAPPGKSGILQLVTNKSRDFSGAILRRTVRTIFIGLSGAAGFGPVPLRAGAAAVAAAEAESETVEGFDLTFDPLDPRDLARANHRMNDAGLCVVMGRFSFDTSAVRLADYCADPLGTVARHPSRAPELTMPMRNFAPETKGILYRPRAGYQVAILGNADPEGPGPWRLIKAQEEAFENLSPVFSIGVDRTLFGEVRTAMLFDDGDLATACTTKSSEMVGAVSVPLEIVRSIVALPAQIIQVDIDQVGLQTQVNQAETKLLKLQNQILQEQLGLEPDPGNRPQIPANAPPDLSDPEPPADLKDDALVEEAPAITDGNSLLAALCGGDGGAGGL